MIDVEEDRSPSGRWMAMRQDGLKVLGAHLPPPDRPGELTVMWAGDPTLPAIENFCRDAGRDLGADQASGWLLRGRVFGRDGRHAFAGARWLEAARQPASKLVRLECLRSRDPAVSRDPIGGRWDGFIAWAALDQRPTSADDEDTVGVSFPVPQFRRIEDRLASLIAASQVDKPDLALVRQLLRTLIAYLGRPSRVAA